MIQTNAIHMIQEWSLGVLDMFNALASTEAKRSIPASNALSSSKPNRKGPAVLHSSDRASYLSPDTEPAL